MKRSFDRYSSGAHGSDPDRRFEARAAIVETAHPFLAATIARIAEVDLSDRSAIDALGRIGNAESRSDLKRLFHASADPRRLSSIALALARIGHPGDMDFLVGVLQDPSAPEDTKRYAAIGVGHIGGDQAVRHLEMALERATAETRPHITMALGSTRSRLAVPVLIRAFGNRRTHSNVCSALITLTHRSWCDGTGDDVALQRIWERWWSENESHVEIYGTDKCPDLHDASPVVR